jgi:hypothetical protein
MAENREIEPLPKLRDLSDKGEFSILDIRISDSLATQLLTQLHPEIEPHKVKEEGDAGTRTIGYQLGKGIFLARKAGHFAPQDKEVFQFIQRMNTFGTQIRDPFNHGHYGLFYPEPRSGYVLVLDRQYQYNTKFFIGKATPEIVKIYQSGLQSLSGLVHSIQKESNRLMLCVRQERKAQMDFYEKRSKGQIEF